MMHVLDKSVSWIRHKLLLIIVQYFAVVEALIDIVLYQEKKISFIVLESYT